VLAHILGGTTTSQLYRTLVVERGVAVNVGAWYQDAALDETRFGVSGTPKPGVTLPQLEEAIDSVIADVIAKGVNADDLERAKNRLIADTVYAQDNQATMARWYGTAMTTGSSVEKVTNWADRVRAVSAQSVQDAARAWLDKRRSVTGYLIKEEVKRGEKRS